MRDSSTLHRILLALTCLGLGFTATVIAQGGPDKGKRPLKLGVVDIGQLFKNYARKDDLESAINKEREEMKKQVEEDDKRLREMKEALDKLYKRGSEQWEIEADKIRLREQELQLKEQRLQRLLKKRVEEFTLQVLTELEATIGIYGNKYEYTLIFKIDRSAKDEAVGALAEQFQERIFRAQISDVLFSDKSVDCTEGVLALLNSPANIEAMRKLAAGSQQGNKPAGGN